jgi:rhodanese-related sulfurtransferase
LTFSALRLDKGDRIGIPVAIPSCMKTNSAPPMTRTEKAPPKVTAGELLRRRRAGETLVLVDVREAAAFAARHIGGSIHAPDSQTTALVKKLQVLGSAILVCGDGRQSMMVARTLGFCGFRTLSCLEGGLAAWEAAGGRVAETTRSGFERELPREEAPGPAEAKPGLFRRLRSLLLDAV